MGKASRKISSEIVTPRQENTSTRCCSKVSLQPRTSVWLPGEDLVKRGFEKKVLEVACPRDSALLYLVLRSYHVIVLSTSEADRAAVLIDLYFQPFRKVVGERAPESADTAVPVAENITGQFPRA